MTEKQVTRTLKEMTSLWVDRQTKCSSTSIELAQAIPTSKQEGTASTRTVTYTLHYITDHTEKAAQSQSECLQEYFICNAYFKQSKTHNISDRTVHQISFLHGFLTRKQNMRIKS